MADSNKNTQDIQNWGDKQQYEAEPHLCDPDKGVEPTVSLISMTPDPLGVMAALNGIYGGRVHRSLDTVTDDDRYQALVDMQTTHLQAPLESIDMHFLIDGVDRAFTHQLVRQRTANYGQESMRFAVLGELLDATTLPPSLQGTTRTERCEECMGCVPMCESCKDPFSSPEQRKRQVWDDAIRAIDEAYHRLVEGGMPSEEARGLLPHATATRIHYMTDLRAMIPHAGNRLCTQAQFHWRSVFNQIVGCIRNAVPEDHKDRWQYEAIADAQWFRPVCYQQGKCPFKGTFDRECSIRGRVDAMAEHGVPSSQWEKVEVTTKEGITLPGINPAHWLLDPGAARI